MQTATSLRQIVGLLFFVAVLGGVYYAFTYIDFFQSARRSADEVNRQTSEIENELLAQLDSLKSIELSGEVFEMKEYALLVDISVPLTKPSVTRTNPFAPY
jgi:hypothetical protein